MLLGQYLTWAAGGIKHPNLTRERSQAPPHPSQEECTEEKVCGLGLTSDMPTSPNRLVSHLFHVGEFRSEVPLSWALLAELIKGE